MGLGVPYEVLSLLYRPPGWIAPLHHHHGFEFTLVIDGEASIIIDEKEYTLTRGMTCLTPPEIPHVLVTKDGYKRLSIKMETAPEDALIRILTSNISGNVIAAIPQLLEFVDEIGEYLRLQTMIAIQKIRNRLEQMLICCVEAEKKQDHYSAFHEKLVHYFMNNLSKNLTLRDISDEFFISQALIERIIYKEFGYGAIHLFRRLKINHACKLLQNTTLSMSEISNCIGFDEQSSFSRLFRKHTGMSPREYQNKLKTEQK